MQEMEKTPKPWPGAMKQLLLTVSDFTKVLDIQGWDATAPGQQPWIVSMQKDKWRWGPAAFTLPGVATLVQALTDGVVLSCFPLQELITNGIHPADIAAHLETDTGKTFFADHCVCLRLEPKSVAFIPMGMAVSPLCTGPHMKDNVAHVLTFSILSTTLASKCSKDVLNSIKSLNEAHLFSAKSSMTMWKERHEAFTQWASSM